ncbi:hypothetical protein ES288_D04G192300v1 [Gossypium darwinii]|uniref:Uncharacterized protein n=2 Tax=Gossypium TaxID=3633 RepID=A0A0D2VKF4_GOSRA|nr:hypothetical protein B456_N026700 [Gossypium raimondii]TYG74562.1 hypothetical protein ES288_D04G192300v1 [Gossypium darwinii]
MNQMKPKPKIKAPAPTINQTTRLVLCRAAGEGETTKVFGPSAPTGGGTREPTVLGPSAVTEEAFGVTVTEALTDLYAIGADCTYIRGNKAKPMKQKVSENLVDSILCTKYMKMDYKRKQNEVCL